MPNSALCFSAAPRFQAGRVSIVKAADPSCVLRCMQRDVMRRESRTGSSRRTRVAQRRTRVANRDAVGRMITILFDWTFDPEPRCMLFGAIQMRTTRTGILNIYKHSETLWKLQLLEILRDFAEICNLNYNAEMSVAPHLLCDHCDFGRKRKVLALKTYNCRVRRELSSCYSATVLHARRQHS